MILEMDEGNNPEKKEIFRLGVDTGGTFTDFVWIDEDGRLQIHKSLSTPDDPAIAVIQGVEYLSIPENVTIIHGSTVSTNALLERRGARTALITTVGFADVLGIGRQDRPDLYALVAHKSEPLVPKELRYEVRERITSTGEILIKLELQDLDLVIRELLSAEVESVAVSLLFSFIRSDHEHMIRERIRSIEAKREADQNRNIHKLHITLSSDLLPEYREYERTSTTVVNAYTAPLMTRYLRSLQAGLAKRKLSVMQNNGGTIRADLAGQQAARTILSGPAGGVVGALYLAKEAGYNDIITLDMGGTSTDVALCLGRLPKTSMSEVSGMPIMLPAIDIHTVGAGGGSLAKIDAGGALLVGPESAGSDPGPVCYQMDIDRLKDLNSQPAESPSRLWVTTTDANLVLGRLDSAHFLGGSKPLNVLAAVEALSELAKALDIKSPIDAAFGVINVANANMARAVRRISIEKGHDPRHFTLVAFGGAGPVHACELAQTLQIPRVLVPLVPGVLSALGMIIAQPVKDYSRTVMIRMNYGEWDAVSVLNEQFLELERKAAEEFQREGHSLDPLKISRQADVRYKGQSHELTVDLPDGVDGKGLAELFHEAHHSRYSFQRPEATLEIVNIRLLAALQIEPPSLQPGFANNQESSELRIGQKPICFEGGYHVSDMYDRAMLLPGTSVNGPAIIFQYDTTTLVPPGWNADVDSTGNLLLTNSNSA